MLSVNESSRLLISRLIKALTLDREFYSDVAADSTASVQALLVVALASLASGIGAIYGGLGQFQLMVTVGILGWLVWTCLAYLIGVRLLGGPLTSTGWGGLARALGFAQAPGLIRVFAVVPGMGIPIALVALVWQFIAMVSAIRQALGYETTWRAIAVVAIGIVPYLAVITPIVLVLRVSQ